MAIGVWSASALQGTGALRDVGLGMERAAMIASKPTMASARKLTVYPSIFGSPLGNTRDVTTLAIAAVPIEPPMVRMFVFIPVATLVWLTGTALTTIDDMDEYASPTPEPRRTVARISSQ